MPLLCSWNDGSMSTMIDTQTKALTRTFTNSSCPCDSNHRQQQNKIRKILGCFSLAAARMAEVYPSRLTHEQMHKRVLTHTYPSALMIFINTSRKQDLHSLGMPLLCSQNNGSPPITVDLCPIHLGRQKEFYDLGLPFTGCQVQWCIFLIILCLSLCAIFQEQIHDADGSSRASHVQSGKALLLTPKNLESGSRRLYEIYVVPISKNFE